MRELKTTLSSTRLSKVLKGEKVWTLGKLSTAAQADVPKIVSAKDISERQRAVKTTLSSTRLLGILTGKKKVSLGKLSPARQSDLPLIINAKDVSEKG
jgi:hypothetical protein